VLLAHFAVKRYVIMPLDIPDRVTKFDRLF